MSRLVSTPASQVAKARRSAEPELAALLRVELGGDDVVARDHRTELDGVVGDAQRVAGVAGHAVVGVHEVEVAAVGHVGGDGVRTGEPHVVPADLGDPVGVGEAPDRAGHPAEPVGVALLAVVEQHLEADADAEERDAVAPHAIAERADEVLLDQAVDGGAGGADAGKDDALGGRDLGRGGGEPGRQPQVLQGVHHARGVAGAVVDHVDHARPKVANAYRRSAPFRGRRSKVDGRRSACGSRPAPTISAGSIRASAAPMTL